MVWILVFSFLHFFNHSPPLVNFFVEATRLLEIILRQKQPTFPIPSHNKALCMVLRRPEPQLRDIEFEVLCPIRTIVGPCHRYHPRKRLHDLCPP